MNSRLVNILIILSPGILLAAYYFKTRAHYTATDQLEQKLQGLQAIVPTNSTLYFNCPPENLETYMQARYLLAPRTVLYTRDTTADTIFYLLPPTAISGNKNIAWQSTDSQFHYQLIINPH